MTPDHGALPCIAHKWRGAGRHAGQELVRAVRAEQDGCQSPALVEDRRTARRLLPRKRDARKADADRAVRHVIGRDEERPARPHIGFEFLRANLRPADEEGGPVLGHPTGGDLVAVGDGARVARTAREAERGPLDRIGSPVHNERQRLQRLACAKNRCVGVNRHRRRMHIFGDQPLVQGLNPPQEIVQARPIRTCPGNLRRGEGARPHLPIEVKPTPERLAPRATLDAAHTYPVFRCKALEGIERERASERNPASGFAEVLERVTVQILRTRIVAPVARRQDDVQPRLGGPAPVQRRAPELHRQVFRHVIRQHLVPCNRPTASRGEELRKAMRHARLQRADIRKAELLHERLTLRTLLPAVRRAFVAPDVDVRGWEQRTDLVQDILDEPHALLICRAEAFVLRARQRERAPEGRIARATTGELGMGGEKRPQVRRHVELGNDLDVARLGVGENLLHVLLRVVIRPIRLARHARIRERAAMAHRIRPDSPLLMDLRMPPEFKPPAFVIRQMPMEDVHLDAAHQVDVALDRLLAEEMTGLVKHIATPGECRPVADLAAGNLKRLRAVPDFLRRTRQLLQRLQRIEATRLRRGPDDNARRRDVQRIAFRRLRRIVNKPHVRARHAIRRQSADARHPLHVARQRRGLARNRAQGHSHREKEANASRVHQTFARRLAH